MIRLISALAVLFALSALAAIDPVAEIASDFGVLLSDTVDQSERSASVRTDEDGNPVIACEKVAKKSEAGVTIAKCRIGVEVTLEDCEEPVATSCFVLYEYKTRGAKGVVRGPEGLFDSCIEDLHSVECGD